MPKTGLYLNLAVTMLVVVFVQLFAEPIIRLFYPSCTDVISIGILYLRICCSANSLVYAAMYTFDSFMTGIGSANIAMVNALLDAAVIRLPVSWLLGFTLNYGFSVFMLGKLSPLFYLLL